MGQSRVPFPRAPMAQAPPLAVDFPSIAALPALALGAFRLAVVAWVITLVPGRLRGNASAKGVRVVLPPA